MTSEEQRAALEARSRARREKLVVHRAQDQAAAEAWDLDYWQSLGPEARLSALVAIRSDIEAVEKGRHGADD